MKNFDSIFFIVVIIIIGVVVVVVVDIWNEFVAVWDPVDGFECYNRDYK